MIRTIELANYQLRAGEVVSLAEEPGAGRRVFNHVHHATVGINTADMSWVATNPRVLAEQQPVLVDEHADADAVHVEAVEEILYVVLGGAVDSRAVLQLDDALGHSLDDVAVPVADVHQRFAETGVNTCDVLGACDLDVYCVVHSPLRQKLTVNICDIAPLDFETCKSFHRCAGSMPIK